MRTIQILEKKQILILILIILIGSFLRIYNLGNNSFWYDEASSIILAKHIGTIHRQLGTDAPLFFLILNPWLPIGKSEFALRLLPAIIGILLIPLLFFFSKRFTDFKTALFATVFLATSPLHIYYSQELRGYTLLPLLFLLCAIFYYKALNDNRKSDWFMFAIFGALSIYTHYFAIFSLFANFLFFLIFIRIHKDRFFKVISFNFLILLLYSPWLYFFLKKTFAFQKFSKFWILQPGIKDIIITIKNFIIGYGAPKWAFYISTFLAIILFLIALPQIFRKKEYSYIFIHLLTPVVLVFILSRSSSNSIYLDRCMIISSVFFLIFIAKGLSSIKIQWLTWGIFIVITFNSFVSLYYIYNNVIPRLDHNFGVRPRKDFRQGAMYIKSQLMEGDLIGHTCRSSLPVFMVYLPGSDNLSLATDYGQINYIKKKYPFQEMWDTPLGKITLPHLIDEAVKGKKRLWLIYGQWDLDIKDRYYETSEEIKIKLLDEYPLISKKEYYGITIYLFSLDKKSHRL